MPIGAARNASAVYWFRVRKKGYFVLPIWCAGGWSTAGASGRGGCVAPKSNCPGRWRFGPDVWGRGSPDILRVSHFSLNSPIYITIILYWQDRKITDGPPRNFESKRRSIRDPTRQNRPCWSLFRSTGITRRVGKANGSGRSLPSGRPDDRLRVPTIRLSTVGTARSFGKPSGARLCPLRCCLAALFVPAFFVVVQRFEEWCAGKGRTMSKPDVLRSW